MESTDPADLSPLSFGAGLALGLMLILGLPRADTSAQPRSSRESTFERRIPGRQPPGLAHASPSTLQPNLPPTPR